jgi:hypothetical protein
MRWICNALGIPGTHLSEMFSVRKLVGSLVVGALTLSVAVGSAGAAADNEVALAVSQRGFAAGLEAADLQIEACQGTCANPQLLEAYRTVSALVEARAAELVAAGEDLPSGPDQAAAVLGRLLNDESPSTLAPGRDQSVLARAYKDLKAQQQKLKTERDRGKPDGVGNPGGPGESDD